MKTKNFIGLLLCLLSCSTIFFYIHAQSVTLEGSGSGLIGWWKFDEGTGVSTVDSSGSAYTGTLVGSVGWLPGVSGNAVELDGSTAYINIPNTALGNLSGYAVAAWIKTTTDGTYLVGDGDSSDVRISSGKVMFTYYSNTFYNLSSKISVTDGNWHHVVAVKNGLTNLIYIDGNLDNSLMTTGTGNVGFQSIGRRYDAATTWLYKGRVDDVRIYNRALSAQDVSALYGQYSASLQTPVTTPITTSAATPVSTPAPTPTPISAPISTPTPTPVQTPTSQYNGPLFYVAPNGSPSGDGSINSPWDLSTALKQPTNLTAGDTLYLRGGTYYGRFTSSLTGTIGNPIIVTHYPGETATIDANKIIHLSADMAAGTAYGSGSMVVDDAFGVYPGLVLRVENEYVQVASVNGKNIAVTRGWNGSSPVSHSSGSSVLFTGNVLMINGADTIYRDLIITDSNSIRAEPRDARIHGTGIDIFGPRVKVINNIIHDTGMGIGTWVQSVDSEVYGNIIYNNGYQDSNLAVGQDNWINGHAIYAQNNQGSKIIADNIIFNQFGLGMHLYSTNSTLNNFDIKGNIHFNDRFLAGGQNPLTNSVFEENYLYNGSLAIGYDNRDNNGITIKNNYLMNGLSLSLSKNVKVQNNTIWNAGPQSLFDVGLRFDGSNNQVSDYTFSGNTYYQPPQSYPYYQFSVSLLPNQCGSYYWFTSKDNGYGYGGCKTNSWQGDLHYDLDSVMISHAPPDVSFVRANKYDANRAHVVVYNWSKQTNADVNLAGSGFAAGDTIEIRNAENYFGPTVSVVADTNGHISVPMTNWTIAEPVGGNATVNSSVLGASTYPTFGVFVLTRTRSSGNPAVPAPAVASPISTYSSTPNATPSDPSQNFRNSATPSATPPTLYTSPASVSLKRSFTIAAGKINLVTLAASSSQATTTTVYTVLPRFTRSLRFGSTGNDVKNLQVLLNWLGFVVATKGAGSSGNETTYFGPATKKALILFQNAHPKEILTPNDLKYGTGIFGPSTLKLINGI